MAWSAGVGSQPGWQRLARHNQCKRELFHPMNAWTSQQCLAKIDSMGIDVQVISTTITPS
jgi:hypothetical protein